METTIDIIVIAVVLAGIGSLFFFGRQAGEDAQAKTDLEAQNEKSAQLSKEVQNVNDEAARINSDAVVADQLREQLNARK